MRFHLFFPWSSLQELDAPKGLLQTWVINMMGPQHLLVNRKLGDRMLDDIFYISYILERKKVGCIIVTVSKTNKQMKHPGAKSSRFSHISLAFLENSWGQCGVQWSFWLSEGKTDDGYSFWNFPFGQRNPGSLPFPTWTEVSLEGKRRVRKPLLPGFPDCLAPGYKRLSANVRRTCVWVSNMFLKRKGL